MSERPNPVTAPAARVLDVTLVKIIGASTTNYLAFGIVTVLLPRLVTDELGAGDFAVGVVVGVFSLAAMLARPVSGRLGNRLGRRTLMLAGALTIGASFALYGVVAALGVLVVLRLVTGVGEAMFYTGAATMVADHAPPDRRTTAIGYYSVAIYVGTGLGPALGQFLADQVGLQPTLVLAGALSSAGGLMSLGLPNLRIVEAPGERQPLINRKSLLPGTVLALGVMGMVAFQAYVPLYTEDLGMAGPQWVFLLYSAVMISIRAFGGPIHRIDPWRSATGATVLIAAGMATMAAVPEPIGLYVGAAVFSAGFAVQFPALMTMAVDRATEQERASAVGTYTAFMNVSLGAGGFLLAIPAALSGYRASFATGALTALLGLLLLRLAASRRPSPVRLVAAAPQG
jgi:MFS family permease